jgi:pimeloyl-ACP methyl ester carboxylesterase
MKMPTSFIYGSNDWMNHKHAVVARENGMASGTNVLVVQEAGHHLYADKPEAFNHALAGEVEGKVAIIKGLIYV